MKVAQQIIEGAYKDHFTFENDRSPVKNMEQLPAGIYTPKDIGGMFSTKIVYNPISLKEKYVELQGGTVGIVMNKLQRFFSNEIRSKYTELGIAHKTGLLLYGPPGTGKTVTSHIIMHNVARKYNAVCLVLENGLPPRVWRPALQELKELKRPIVLFLDECEEMLESQESIFLTLLDGHESFDNFMFIGCTNHMRKISKRMLRPSRIEHLIEVKSIEEEVAKQYVDEKVSGLSGKVKAAMVHFAMENGATIDAFKNAVKEYYIYSDTSRPELFEKVLREYIREDKEYSN